MRNLLLSALLVACASASAADQPQPYVKKFDVKTPDLLPGKRAEVEMPLLRRTPAPTPAAPVATSNAAPAPSGMPMIPASEPANTAASAPASTTATSAPTNPATTAPGQPVTVYATMAQAAKAGVDPLNELKPTAPVATTASAPAAPVTASGFNLKNPGSWLPWVQTHKEQAMKTAMLALGILVLGFGAIRVLARRKSQE